MSNSESTQISVTAEELALRTIRDLVAEFPLTMGVLAPLGIDLCCGGAHPVGEAITLHGADPAVVLPQVAAVVSAAREQR
jgi:iron-sulfur cluster repair protein YtfE (RIC family)